MPSVLILGARAPVALDHARRFAAQGWTVHVADSVSCRLSGWSRSVTSSIKLRPPRTDAKGFIADIARAVHRHAIDLLVPTCEEVFFLARYRTALPAALQVCIDDFDKLRALHSKLEFQDVCRREGYCTPATSRICTLDEAREWAQGKAVVLKPEFSRFGVHTRIYPEGIPEHANALDPRFAWVVQAHCSGQEISSYSVAAHGRLLAHSVYSTRYRLANSASYYFSHYTSTSIRQRVASMVQMLNFTGQISFDWIEGEDGTIRALECNPRATSGLHLFALKDPIPSTLAGLQNECIEPHQRACRSIASMMYTVGARRAWRDKRWSQWASDAALAEDVISVPGDWFPLAGAVIDFASFSKNAYAQRCSLREAATRDIEWDGEQLESL